MSDQISDEVRNDYDALLEGLMPFAQQMLEKHGEFYPFGMAVTTEGEVVAQATEDAREMPPPNEILNSLVSTFQREASAGKIRAVGICSDGRIALQGKETDAIIASLEHVSGNACKACVPYSKGLFGKYRFGEMSAGSAEPRIFNKA